MLAQSGNPAQSLTFNDLKMVKVAGIEPARAGESIPSNKRDSARSTEALIKILTNLPDSERRFLPQIIEFTDFACGLSRET